MVLKVFVKRGTAGTRMEARCSGCLYGVRTPMAMRIERARTEMITGIGELFLYV